ncbi:hypothetical protein PSYMO_11665, partial [Pseudomonas amygdali pv. mori str. 301020]
AVTLKGPMMRVSDDGCGGRCLKLTNAWSGNASANTRSVLAAIVGSWLELSVVSIADAMAVRTSLSEGLSGLIELDFELCTTSW